MHKDFYNSGVHNRFAIAGHIAFVFMNHGRR